jgi:hypothetical protein
VFALRVFALRVFALRVFALRVFALRVFALRVFALRVFALRVGKFVGMRNLCIFIICRKYMPTWQHEPNLFKLAGSMSGVCRRTWMQRP